MILVSRKLPCGHETELPCHVDYEKYKCEVTVLNMLTFSKCLTFAIENTLSGIIHWEHMYDAPVKAFKYQM